MSSRPMRGRQRTFAEKIAEGHSATEAYLLAGYKPAKRETAHRAASRLYRTPAVRAYIQDLRRESDHLAREQTTLTIAQKLAFLTRLGLTSSASLREDDPLIQSHRILKDGSTSIRIPCKLKALKMHSELAGHFPPEPAPPPKTSDPIQDLLDQIRRSATNTAREERVPPRPANQNGKTSAPASQSRQRGQNAEHVPQLRDASAHLCTAGTQSLGEIPSPSKTSPPPTNATREGRVPPRPAHQTDKPTPPSHSHTTPQTHREANLFPPTTLTALKTKNPTPQQTTTNPPSQNDPPPQRCSPANAGRNAERVPQLREASAHLCTEGTQGLGTQP